MSGGVDPAQQMIERLLRNGLEMFAQVLAQHLRVHRGPVTIDVLWPQGQWADDQVSDPNNSSIAIILRAPDFLTLCRQEIWSPNLKVEIAPLIVGRSRYL